MFNFWYFMSFWCDTSKNLLKFSVEADGNFSNKENRFKQSFLHMPFLQVLITNKQFRKIKIMSLRHFFFNLSKNFWFAIVCFFHSM